MERTSQTWDLAGVPTPLYRLETGKTLRDVAAVLFRRRRVMLSLFVWAFAAAAMGAVWLRPVLDPPVWTSGLKLMVRRDRVDAVVTPAERSMPGIQGSIAPQEVLAEIELLKSADVVERLARETGAPEARLRAGLAAEPVASGRNTTNLIAVRYSAREPGEVQRVLGRLPEVYLEKHLSVNRRPGVAEYFRSQAEAREGELAEAEREMAEFGKRAPAAGAGTSQEQAVQKIAEIERLRAAGEAALRESESGAAELERRLATTPAELRRERAVAPSRQLERLRGQLVEMEGLRAKTTRYREIEQLEARIGEVRAAIAAEPQGPSEENVPNPARAALETELVRGQAARAGLRARVETLADLERRSRGQAAVLRVAAAEDSVRLAEISRRVKAAEENLLFYRRKHAEARESELLDRNRVVNVSLAEGPREPVRTEKRSLRFYLAVAFSLAMAFGAAGGFAAELADRSVHTPRQLETWTALPVLACIAESRQG